MRECVARGLRSIRSVCGGLLNEPVDSFMCELLSISSVAQFKWRVCVLFRFKIHDSVRIRGLLFIWGNSNIFPDVVSCVIGARVITIIVPNEASQSVWPGFRDIIISQSLRFSYILSIL